jgi:hypothetical protein
MAVKHYHSMKNSPKYFVPKKGTPEYNEVKAIQASMINGDGMEQLGTGVISDVKNEIVDNVKLYKRTKKNIKDANNIYEKTKPLQYETISNIKRLNSGVNKYKSILGYGQNGGSLKKAIQFATNQPDKFAEFVNQVAKQGAGHGKKQTGGFLPAFVIPFIPAITTALGAFATGAAGALGAAAVDAIVGDGLTQLGGEMNYNKKQTALLKAVEGEKKSAKPNKARDNRIMRKYKKNLKSMTGSGVENIVLENPEESFEVGKVIFGSPTAPQVKNGKVVLPPTPLENLWNMLF